jgi:hypothetical protein
MSLSVTVRSGFSRIISNWRSLERDLSTLERADFCRAARVRPRVFFFLPPAAGLLFLRFFYCCGFFRGDFASTFSGLSSRFSFGASAGSRAGSGSTVG